MPAADMADALTDGPIGGWIKLPDPAATRRWRRDWRLASWRLGINSGFSVYWSRWKDWSHGIAFLLELGVLGGNQNHLLCRVHCILSLLLVGIAGTRWKGLHGRSTASHGWRIWILTRVISLTAV
jgi:hypothetical protein